MAEPYKVLRMPDVVARVGLRRSSIYAYMSQGEFPRPIRIDRSAVAWRESDIIHWLASRVSA